MNKENLILDNDTIKIFSNDIIKSQQQAFMSDKILKSVIWEQKLKYFVIDWNNILNNYDTTNDIYFFLTTLIFNTFIRNHLLVDGNKRMFYLLTNFIHSNISLIDLV